MMMRRKDRLMPEEFALSIVDKCVYATLAMTDEGGRPYGVPLSIARDGRDIYFHCALEGRKISALRQNPQVCLVCVGRTRVPEGLFSVEYESAIVFGLAREVNSPEEKASALRLLSQRHTPGNMADFDRALAKDMPRTAVWKIEIESLTGKRTKYDS